MVGPNSFLCPPMASHFFGTSLPLSSSFFREVFFTFGDFLWGFLEREKEEEEEKNSKGRGDLKHDSKVEI